jgi:hypothetical protein
MTRSKQGDDVADPGARFDLDFGSYDEAEVAQTTFIFWGQHTHAIAGSAIAGLLTPLKTQVNRVVPGPNNISFGNAYFDPIEKTLNFFRSVILPAGQAYLNTATPDVIAHEYGHAIDDALGGIRDSGYSEGFGDSLAVFVTQQPLIGREILGPGTVYRDLRVVHTYSPGAEVHEQGHAYGGFTWDLVQSLIPAGATPAQIGQAYDTVRDLTLGAAVLNPTDIPQAVRHLLTIDDDDNDLTNGTPHSAQVSAAARPHAIPLPMELPVQPAVPAFDVAAAAPPPNAPQPLTPIQYRMP